MLADKLYSAQKDGRLSRSEDLLEELRANLIREQETARVGGRAIDHLNSLARDVDVLQDIINSRSTYQSRIRKAKEILHGISVDQNNRNRELAAMKFSLKMSYSYAVNTTACLFVFICSPNVDDDVQTFLPVSITSSIIDYVIQIEK